MGRKEMAKGGILDGRPRATDLQGGMLSPDLQCDILTPNMQGQDQSAGCSGPGSARPETAGSFRMNI